MAYYADIRKEEILVVTTWMDPENITLSEISQSEKAKSHDFTYTWDIKQKATTEQTDRQNYKLRQQYGGYQREGVVWG